MTAKKYLQQTFELWRNIDSKAEQLLRLQELSKKMTTLIDGVPSGNVNSQQERALVEIAAQSEKLNAEISRMLDKRAEIVAAISQLENPAERLILEYRYLSFMQWRKIAETMRLSMERVFRLHRDALKKISALTANDS